MSKDQEAGFWKTVTFAGPVFVFILVAYLLKEYTELSRVLIAVVAFGFAALDVIVLRYLKSTRERD